MLIWTEKNLSSRSGAAKSTGYGSAISRLPRMPVGLQSARTASRSTRLGSVVVISCQGHEGAQELSVRPSHERSWTDKDGPPRILSQPRLSLRMAGAKEPACGSEGERAVCPAGLLMTMIKLTVIITDAYRDGPGMRVGERHTTGSVALV